MKRLLTMLVMLMAAIQMVTAKETTLNDVLGREVTVDLPAKRIVNLFYYVDYIAVGGVDSFDNVVGFSKYVWETWTPRNWDLFKQAMPQLANIADVGEVETGTFSIEKVLELKPDLIIMADWQYQAVSSDLGLIEAANIPIIVLDYNKEEVESHVKSTELLGQITGQSERAQAIIDNYTGIIKHIHETVDKANRPRPKAYLEFGKRGPNDVGTTYGDNMWGKLIELARGENISKPFVGAWGKLNPEQVISIDPDVIFISGAENEYHDETDGMAIGIGVPVDFAQKRLAGFAVRETWQELQAIKNKRIYGLYHGASRNSADGAAVQFVAKQLYPDLFADLDPEETYLNYWRTFLPVVPEGSFMVEPDNR